MCFESRVVLEQAAALAARPEEEARRLGASRSAKRRGRRAAQWTHPDETLVAEPRGLDAARRLHGP